MPDDYRQHLIESYEQLSLGYAKTLVTLAGGALGLTLTFAKSTVLGTNNSCVWVLIWAWASWGLSLAAVLFGFYFGRDAARHAIDQFDGGKLEGKGAEQPGGWRTRATHIAGFIGLVTFLAGMVLFIVYVSMSLE